MSAFPYYHPIEVRYGDLDPQGHVNNAKYLTYIEQARVGYIRHRGLWDGRSFMRLGIILADAHVSYRQPIQWGQPVRVGVRPLRLGNKSFTLAYRIEGTDAGTVFADCETVLVCYDYTTGKTVPIPPDWRAVLSADMEEPSATATE